MFKRNALITTALAAVVLLSSAPYGQADEYVTTVDLETPLFDVGINTVVLYWSTNKTTGNVDRTELLDYSMELWSVDELIYTDTILICGEVQPILGDVPRDNPSWGLELEPNNVVQGFNNGWPSSPLPETGTGYGVFAGNITANGNVNVAYYKDGVWDYEQSRIKDWGFGNPNGSQSTVVVRNPPVADAGGPYLGVVDSPIAFDGTDSSDPDSDPLDYDWDFGDSGSGSGPAPSHTYGAVGIYDVCLTVTDPARLSDTDCTMAVVYDPSAGFVTGGGWIYSDPGAYVPDPTLEGKANFGFVSKYKKGATVPTGNTEFQFKAGSLNFHSSSYDWLLVTGSNYAKFKGIGTVNGSGAYKFQIWAGDDSPDTFRIKIWTEDEDGVEVVVYDNGFDQTIDGGSIMIHAK